MCRCWTDLRKRTYLDHIATTTDIFDVNGRNENTNGKKKKTRYYLKIDLLVIRYDFWMKKRNNEMHSLPILRDTHTVRVLKPHRTREDDFFLAVFRRRFTFFRFDLN